MPAPQLSRRFDNRPGFWKRRRREGVLLLAGIVCALVWKSLGPDTKSMNAGQKVQTRQALGQISFEVDSTLWQSAELVGPAELMDSLSRHARFGDGEAEALALSDSRLIFRRIALDGTIYVTKKPVTH